MLENDVIEIIKRNKKLLIKKRILIPFSKDELHEQHNFVNYLYSNNIKVAKILGSYSYRGNLYEYQEYIEPEETTMNINDMVIAVSLFHECSKKSGININKKSTYDMDFECNNHKLSKIIIGYDDKYSKYPLDNYNKLKDKMGFSCNKKYNEIMDYYQYCFNYIKTKYKEPDCIIHNDISRNNILCHGKSLYLIDFDLCIKSYEIVDVTDIVLSNYYGLDNIINNYDEIRKVIKDSVETYNKYNNIGIQDNDILFQLFLKIVSYNCYVILNKNNKEEFENNFSKVHKILKLIREE